MFTLTTWLQTTIHGRSRQRWLTFFSLGVSSHARWSLSCKFLRRGLLCNCVPHFISGLRGEPFPTPSAKPRGVGDSSALLNFFWGSLNLFAGIALLSPQATEAPPIRLTTI